MARNPGTEAINKTYTKEGKHMPSLADILRELKELDVSPNEIDIPHRLYRRIIDQAEELCEETEETEYD